MLDAGRKRGIGQLFFTPRTSSGQRADGRQRAVGTVAGRVPFPVGGMTARLANPIVNRVTTVGQVGLELSDPERTLQPLVSTGTSAA